MKFVAPKSITSQLVSQILAPLGLSAKEANKGVYDGSWYGSGPVITSVDPATNEPIGSIQTASPSEFEKCLGQCKNAKRAWQDVPAPKRGEIVRQMRLALEEKSTLLGQLVSLEMGKMRSEGLGEVQEYLDVCDYAVGLSRQLNGQVIPSERMLLL